MKTLATIEQELQDLKAAGNLRQLSPVQPEGIWLWHQGRRYLNVSSNDYLGLTATPWAGINLAEQTLVSQQASSFAHGNPASRLMTGNSMEYEWLESELAALFPGKTALTLGCGYMVNSGLMPALVAPGELILADKLSHASMIEGLKLSGAEFKRFRHNDINHLEHLLRQAGGRPVTVMVESVYSMDGDLAPLQDIVKLKQQYPFTLYVDEAHSFGTRGPCGAGYCAELGLLDAVDLLVCTLGKALAGAGACVLCHPQVRDYLINRMRPLIFSTALPPCTLQWDALMVHALRTDETPSGCPPLSVQRHKLQQLIAQYNRLTGSKAQSQIIPLPMGSNERALAMTATGQEAGFWLTAIRHPTVPTGQARIRLSLHAEMPGEQLTRLISLCNKPG